MGMQDRGFASMDKARQREIASSGGRAAHAKGTAHEWDHDEAVKAGRKGGTVSRGGKVKSRRDDEDRAARDTKTALAHDLPVPAHVPADDLSRFADEGNPHHE